MWQLVTFVVQSTSHYSFSSYCYKNTLETFSGSKRSYTMGSILTSCGQGGACNSVFVFSSSSEAFNFLYISGKFGDREAIDLSPGSDGELWDQLPHSVNKIWLVVCVVNYPCNHSMSRHPRALEIKKKISNQRNCVKEYHTTDILCSWLASNRCAELYLASSNLALVRST